MEDQPARGRDGEGSWWSVYHDPELDQLERMVNVSNQTVKSFEAQYRNAVALVAEARAGFFPILALRLRSPAAVSAAVATRSRLPRSCSSVVGGGSGSSGGNRTEYSVTGTVAWDPDIWGKIRRQVESNKAERKSARLIWRTRSCRRKRRWRPIISIYGPGIRSPSY